MTPEDERRLARILASPSQLRADEDLAFLSREETRPIRLQLEYLKPELAFEARGIRHTIVVFGGARVCAPEEARDALERLRGGGGTPEEIARAERRLASSRYYEVARDFGRRVGLSGDGPEDDRLVLVTGGGPGLMEAANRGACEVGASSVGLNILLPREQRPNAYLSPDLSFQFRYFALRKMHFMLRARALVAFPGGYGTFDELFETLCLIQTGKHDPMPVVLVGAAFWSRAVDFDFLLEEGVIDEGDRRLFHVVETAEEAWSAIEAWYTSRGLDLLDGEHPGPPSDSGRR